MGLSRQEHWSGLPFPPPGDLSDLEIKPESLTFAALAGGLFTTGVTWEAPDDRGGNWQMPSYHPAPDRRRGRGRPGNQCSHGRQGQGEDPPGSGS